MISSWEKMKWEAELAARNAGPFELRPLQEKVLHSLAHGNHVFAGLPTGYGKSACYWIPAQAWGWRVWVISPLISLIEDQALACQQLGVKALALRSSFRAEDRNFQKSLMEAGDWRVCFLSPERLQAWSESGYLRELSQLGLEPDLVVLDEMHCLEEWRNFRSGYQDVFGRIRRLLGKNILFLGLSASLSKKESRAWMEELCGSYVHISCGLGRSNLVLKVIPLEGEEARWLFLIEQLRGVSAPESALIYCGTRRETDELTRWLRSAGIDAVAYHAGVPKEERGARSSAFREGRLRVVCATSAFGMGIDYPHVSLVVHFSMPHDLESYWQEVGRAGRGGQKAQAIAFWRRSEISRLRRMRNDSDSRERFISLWRAWISGLCRKRVVAMRLGEEQENCGVCDCCLRSESQKSEEKLPWWLESSALAEEWLEEKIKSTSG